MASLDALRGDSRVPGGLVSAIGLVLTAVHALHGFGELPENLPAVATGSVLPLIVALLVVAGGYWVTTHDWLGVSPWRAVAWCVGAGLLTAALSGVLLWYLAAEGVHVEHSQFVPPMFGTYGAAVGLVLARYDAGVREAREALQRQNRRLDEFASIVSHDLRNPLNVAQGYVDKARRTGDLDALDCADAAHERMETILSDMLTLARTGQDALETEALDLETIATRAWGMVRTEESELRVERTRPVSADPGRLESLFENLFRNALEHNDGPVTVTVGATDTGFFVADDGTGIDPEDRERVFEAGYTTGGGSGLGLSIVRAAADAHGWEHRVTDGADGARFEFVLDPVAE